MDDSSVVPDWAQSPSDFESVMYCYGLGGAALQARTVDPKRKQPAYEPVFTYKATPEDLLAAWPQTHDDFNKIEHITALNILKIAMYDYQHSISGAYTSYRGLGAYQQHYVPLAGPGQHPTLAQIWNEDVQSKQGLVRDLVADISDIPAQVMLLPIRIRQGPWTDKPARTVLLVDMRQQDWLPQNQSLRLAYKCKSTLKRHGFHDVEVEVRAVPSSSWEAYPNSISSRSTVSRSQTAPSTDTLQQLKQARIAYINNYLTPDSSSLPYDIVYAAKRALNSCEFPLILKGVGTPGLEISAPQAKSGTMGLLLRLQRAEHHPERLVGLNCHHVVQRPYCSGITWLSTREPYLRPDPGVKDIQDPDEEFSRDIYLSHPDNLSSLLDAFNKVINTIRAKIRNFGKEAQISSENGDDHAEEMSLDLQVQK
ncbi:hypothetical protein CC79DRAFT_1369310 [Sarocladium strictum]